MRDTLPVADVFGPVWQGEGAYLGQRCGFVRLGLCNLSCEWCDTAYTWDRTRYDVDAECPPHTAAQLLDKIRALPVSLLVLSGGEPLIHQQSQVLLDVLEATDHEWHIETNGTIKPTTFMRARIEHFTVSPKVATHDPDKLTHKPAALAVFAELARDTRATFKIVASTEADVDAAEQLRAAYGIPRWATYIMPEGTDAATLIARHRQLAQRIEAHKLNTTTRLHVLLHGDERGH